MALLTIRQKQYLIGYFSMAFLVLGFIAGVIQGNPVAVSILIVLLLLVGLWIFLGVRKRRRVAAAKLEAVQRKERQYAENLAEVQRRMLAKPAIRKQEPATVSFQIPVMSDDTLESLTVRVLEQYAERGGTIPVAEAKAMAAKALAEQSQ